MTLRDALQRAPDGWTTVAVADKAGIAHAVSITSHPDGYVSYSSGCSAWLEATDAENTVAPEVNCLACIGARWR